MSKTTKLPASKKIVVAVSGYFNPLHVGHLEMISLAKKLGDKLVVIVNNDRQVKLKGSVPFMKERDRLKIIRALRDVDQAILSIDDYKLADGSVPIIKTLAKLKPDIFANGGDRHNLNDVPEYKICQKLGIKMVDGLGRKIRSSSILIANSHQKVVKEINTKSVRGNSRD